MASSRPTHADLERAIVSVPGVAEAHVSRVEETGKSRLRIRLASEEDAESVSWSIAATLRERFGISLDPEQIRPRTMAAPVTDDGSPIRLATADEPHSETGGSDAGDGVLVTGDRLLLSEAARALLEEAVAEARENGPDAAARHEASAVPSGPDAPGVDEASEVGPVDAEEGSATSSEFGAAGQAPEPDAVAAVTSIADVATDGDAADVATDGDAADVVGLDRPPHAWDDLTRARISHLDTRVDISDVEVTATLAFAGREVAGSARSVATEQGILRAVAEATLHALAELTGERLVAGIDSVAASVSGDPAIATVVVSLVTDRGDESLLGSSLVRRDPQRAVMRATLDALNRRVEPWLEVDIAG